MPHPLIACAKCGHENPATVRFCRRCHTPTQYECPACHHVQQQGGTCQKCGTDFAKYAAMLVMQAQTNAQQARQAAHSRQSIIKQIILLPVTGGFSLIKHLRSLMHSE